MKTIGRYNVIRKIGSGGMAEVFLTRSRGAQGTEKLLVVKKIHPALSQSAKFIDMFVDEARVAMRLNHTNIVQVYNFEQIDDGYLLAMEYVDGVDLLELESIMRKEGRRFPFGLAAYIAAEAAKGLDYAHSRRDDRGEPLGIVHRDVSPQNILLSREGAVKVTDFGIARARWIDEEVAGTIKGKFGYMAPEQAASKVVDLRSDVYSLGIVLYEMLIGRPLVKFGLGEDPLNIIRTKQHPSPKKLEPSVPDALAAIVERAICLEVDQRYTSTREMVRALREFLHSETEIYDSQSLESCVEDASEALQASRPSGIEAAATIAEIHNKSPRETTTVPSTKLGEVERRSAVHISGHFDVESHPARNEVMVELMRLVGEMAYKTEGVLRQSHDGFSVYLGLFHSTLEDAVRGIRLAYDIIDAKRAIARDHRIKCHVRLAVNRGIVCKIHGDNETHPRFDPDTDLAASAVALRTFIATDEIAADAQIYRLARKEYHFESISLDEDTITEQGDDVRVYRVGNARGRGERSLISEEGRTFFGRQYELDFLEQSLREAQGGKTVVVRITGEMGIGKSRLVQQFLKSLPGDRANVVTTECLFAERNQPLAATSAAIRAVIGLNETVETADLQERLGELICEAPQYLRRQQHFFESFLNSPDAHWSAPQANRRELIQRAAFGLGVLISIIATRQSTVLVVENAHWLDGPSADVLTELARERVNRPILVVLVGQTGTLADRKISDVKEIELRSLSDKVLKNIILEQLGTGEAIEEIALQILSRAQGNPFFAGEIIDSLVEQRILEQVTSENTIQYRQARPGRIRLPATMEGIAASKIDALGPDFRTVLRTASAIGTSFTAVEIEGLVGDNVTTILEALLAQELLARMPGNDQRENAFRFRQTMLREAAYGGLSDSDRQRIHRVMSKRLIDMSDRGEVVPKVRIAWHLDRHGDSALAGKYYTLAATEAITVYSNREALKLYDRGIPLLPHDSVEKFEAQALRERSLRDLGRYKERAGETAEMKRIADTLGDDSLKSLALTRIAQLKYDLGEFSDAARNLGESLALAARADDVSRQVEALRLLSYVAIEDGHLIRALDCSERALSVIPGTNETSLYLKGRVLGVKGFALYNMGHLDNAATPLAEALVLFRKIGKRRNLSLVMSNLALLAQARGELDEAVDFLTSAMRIDAEVRAISARGRKMVALGSIYSEMGDYSVARRCLIDGRIICRENHERLGQVEADLGLAELVSIDGNWDRARAILEKVGQRGFVANSRLLLVRHRQITALALFATGQFRAARRLAEEATKIAMEAGMNGDAVHAGVRQGYILAKTGFTGEALSTSRRATDLMAMLGKVRQAEEIWWYQAQTMHITGNAFRAERALSKAREAVAAKRGRIKDQSRKNTLDSHPTIRAINAGLEDIDSPPKPSSVGGAHK
jgi:eukaryotic-like serine/threonine-protein kinase